MQYKKIIAVTGGAGFIGSNLIRHLVSKYENYLIINVDCLTYAGNLANLKYIADRPNYIFENIDITDYDGVKSLFARYEISDVLHLAAESHVDRSIKDPFAFARTNVMGTLNLLENCRMAWADNLLGKRFYHISTDEVYGSLPLDGSLFSETTAYDPRSPYSASKASSDHFVMAYYHTHSLPIIMSNCSNNYGAYQFPEKLIPLMINNIKESKPLPIYGKGENIRDWLYVEDHIDAIDLILHRGELGQSYNIGGKNEKRNIDIVHTLISIVDRKLGRKEGYSLDLIRFVEDRKGHDMRYAIDASKLERELGWKAKYRFEEGIEKTVDWYLANQEWLSNIISGEYQNYYREMYKEN